MPPREHTGAVRCDGGAQGRTLTMLSVMCCSSSSRISARCTEGYITCEFHVSASPQVLRGTSAIHYLVDEDRMPERLGELARVQQEVRVVVCVAHIPVNT